LPSTDIVTFKPRTTKIPKYNIPHFIDQHVKNKSYLPSPQAYETTFDWKTVLKNRGKFLTSPRVTSTEKILKDKVLILQPGPASYTLTQSSFKPTTEKIIGKSEKVCEFIEEAMYVGKATPGHSYSLSMVNSKSLTILDASRPGYEVRANS
jgi:hypothetical protein